jgi:hypothetical protein
MTERIATIRDNKRKKETGISYIQILNSTYVSREFDIIKNKLEWKEVNRDRHHAFVTAKRTDVFPLRNKRKKILKKTIDALNKHEMCHATNSDQSLKKYFFIFLKIEFNFGKKN